MCFDFIDVLGVCVMVSNGFYVFSLGVQFYQVIGSCLCGIMLVVQVFLLVVIVLGVILLKLEKVINYSLGVIWDLSLVFYLVVDVYQIDICGQFGQFSQVGYNVQDLVCIIDNSGMVLIVVQKNIIDVLLGLVGISIFLGDVFYVSYFINVGNICIRGVELILEVNQEMVWGKLCWSYVVNVGCIMIWKVSDILVVLQGLFNINLLIKSSEYVLCFCMFCYMQVVGLGWQNGCWCLNVDFIYYGLIKCLNNGVEYKQLLVLVINLFGGVELGVGWSVVLGINNVFDKCICRVLEYVCSVIDVVSIDMMWDLGDVLSWIGMFWYGWINYWF